MNIVTLYREKIIYTFICYLIYEEKFTAYMLYLCLLEFYRVEQK